MDNKANPKDVIPIPHVTKNILFNAYSARKFSCPYPKCNKWYTPHNRLTIHLRTHV